MAASSKFFFFFVKLALTKLLKLNHDFLHVKQYGIILLKDRNKNPDISLKKLQSNSAKQLVKYLLNLGHRFNLNFEP